MGDAEVHFISFPPSWSCCSERVHPEGFCYFQLYVHCDSRDGFSLDQEFRPSKRAYNSTYKHLLYRGVPVPGTSSHGRRQIPCNGDFIAGDWRSYLIRDVDDGRLNANIGDVGAHHDCLLTPEGVAREKEMAGGRVLLWYPVLYVQCQW